MQTVIGVLFFSLNKMNQATNAISASVYVGWNPFKLLIISVYVGWNPFKLLSGERHLPKIST